MNHSNFFRIYFDVNAVNEKEELLPAVKGATLGYRNIHALLLISFLMFSTECTNRLLFSFFFYFFSLFSFLVPLPFSFLPFFAFSPAIYRLIRHVLNEALLRRNLSISQLAIYELPGTSDLSKCNRRMNFFSFDLRTNYFWRKSGRFSIHCLWKIFFIPFHLF